MQEQKAKISYAFTEDFFVIASQKAIDNGVKDLCFFGCTGIPNEVNGRRWRDVEITYNSYLSPNFSIVDIDRAFRTIAIETANEFCAELNRDVPGYAWIVIKYTKVEAFQEV